MGAIADLNNFLQSPNFNNATQAAQGVTAAATTIASSTASNIQSGALNGVSMPDVSALGQSAVNAASAATGVLTNPSTDPAAAFKAAVAMEQLMTKGLSSGNLANQMATLDATVKDLEKAAPGSIEAIKTLTNVVNSIANDQGLQSLISVVDPNLAKNLGTAAKSAAAVATELDDYQKSNYGITKAWNASQLDAANTTFQGDMKAVIGDLQRLGV